MDNSSAEFNLAALRNGDEAEFTRLIRRYHNTLLGLVRPLVGDARAEEVVQEAWIKAHKACSRFEGRSQVKTWLCSIALNEARMLLRQQKQETQRRQFNSNDGDFLADHFTPGGHWRSAPARWNSDSPDELLMRSQLLDCLDKTLTALPGLQQALIRRRDIDGETFDQICNELDISASNARVLLHRGRSFLYKTLDHYQETGEC